MMDSTVQFKIIGMMSITLLLDCARADERPKPWTKHQYIFEEIQIPIAHKDEPLNATFSFQSAVDYLDQGAVAWSKKQQCISCHTNGSYLLTRPMLTKTAGPPDEGMRDFFEEQLKDYLLTDRDELKEGITPTQICYLAAGLAEWDTHVTKSLSPETKSALSLMFETQSEDGSFNNIDCWPPFESSPFHSATVAAWACLTAPDWIDDEATNRPELSQGYQKLIGYLCASEPPHEYGRLLRMRVSSLLPNLVTPEERQNCIQSVWSRQNPDGGWALRSFATPETWGNGNRSEKLTAEPEDEYSQSDGHMTGLAVLALVENGISKSDPRIQKALNWILTHQRQSGRWWTRSLNTDKYHFITYSGTCYPIMALVRCDLLK